MSASLGSATASRDPNPLPQAERGKGKEFAVRHSLFFDLALAIVFDADALDQTELRLEPIDVFFL
jgi:hypothetical protein